MKDKNILFMLTAPIWIPIVLLVLGGGIRVL